MERRKYVSRKNGSQLSRLKTQPEATSQPRTRCCDADVQMVQTTGSRHLGRLVAMVAAPAFQRFNSTRMLSANDSVV
jgi:hypothetical protein